VGTSRDLSQQFAAPTVPMMFIEEVRRSAMSLDADVALWMIRALDSGWFRIAPGTYEQAGPGAAVCPIVAAATMAGVWRDGQLLPGNPAWGSADRPSTAVEDFAAYFDLCSEACGVAMALETVRGALISASSNQTLVA
jgi:hypothetical protein